MPGDEAGGSAPGTPAKGLRPLETPSPRPFHGRGFCMITDFIEEGGGGMERVTEWLLDVLFPEGNACHLCESGCPEAGILCMRCMERLHAQRLKPFASVHSRPHPPIKICISAFPHEGEARELVHLLKYSADRAAAPLLGECMAHSLAVSAAGG